MTVDHFRDPQPQSNIEGANVIAELTTTYSNVYPLNVLKDGKAFELQIDKSDRHPVLKAMKNNEDFIEGRGKWTTK